MVPKLSAIQVAPLSVLLNPPLLVPTYIVEGVTGSKAITKHSEEWGRYGWNRAPVVAAVSCFVKTTVYKSDENN